GGIDISTGSGTQDIDILSGASLNLTAREAAADAIVISAPNKGGIDISTGYDAGSGQGLDLLAGLTLNLKAVNGDISLSAGAPTVASGLTVDSATGYVGVADSSPAALFTVGSGDALQIDNSGNVTTTGDIAVNGDDITADGALTINSASYVRIGDTGTPGLASGDDDLYVEGDLEVDAILDLDGSFDMDGTTFDVNNTGAISLLTSSGTANAIQLVASAGGIDISTGSGTQDIDILSGDALNLKAVGGNISFSSGTSTARSGVIINTSGDLAAYGTTTFGGITYTWPGTQSTNYVLSTNGSGTLSWSDPTGLAAASVYWNQSNGLLYPKNSTVDVSIGG
ncbi:MAG: hypothetical protein AAB541_02195, partial [Patescibacteria group bacterium]